MTGGHKTVQIVLADIAGALMLFVLAGSARAGLIDQLGALGAKTDSAISAENSSAPDTSMPLAASSGITSFSGRGTGVLNLVATHLGVCSDSLVACNVAQCECDVFGGTVTVPKLGSSTLSLNITTSDSTLFSNGIGQCFPGSGHGTICHGSSCLGILAAGTICTTIISEIDSNNGEAAFEAIENFYIVKGASTGSVAGASGGGSLQITDDIPVVSSVIGTPTGYATLNGALQLHP